MTANCDSFAVIPSSVIPHLDFYRIPCYYLFEVPYLIQNHPHHFQSARYLLYGPR